MFGGKFARISKKVLTFSPDLGIMHSMKDLANSIVFTLLVSVDSCTYSAMGDIYDPANTEFIHDDAHWSTHCANTLAARTLERDEWQTIHLWYPWLVTPVLTNTGPSRMPFDFTSVTTLDPVSATDTLEDPTFYLDYANDEISSSEARAYLLRDADGADLPPADGFEYVYDLGSPTGDRTASWPAVPGPTTGCASLTSPMSSTGVR